MRISHRHRSPSCLRRTVAAWNTRFLHFHPSLCANSQLFFVRTGLARKQTRKKNRAPGPPKGVPEASSPSTGAKEACKEPIVVLVATSQKDFLQNSLKTLQRRRSEVTAGSQSRIFHPVASVCTRPCSPSFVIIIIVLRNKAAILRLTRDRPHQYFAALLIRRTVYTRSPWTISPSPSTSQHPTSVLKVSRFSSASLQFPGLPVTNIHSLLPSL